MSLSVPSHVSATTGSDHGCSCAPCFRPHAIDASRTTPTLWVLVMKTGPSRKPPSSIQVVPVISPLPFIENQPAITGSVDALPRGRMAVTPVRTGPFPTWSAPCPSIRVTSPTSTPATSVIAFRGPAVPSNGTPRSRARGLAGCAAAGGDRATTSIRASVRINSPIRSAERAGGDTSSRGRTRTRAERPAPAGPARTAGRAPQTARCRGAEPARP